jgi:hypothetical protein
LPTFAPSSRTKCSPSNSTVVAALAQRGEIVGTALVEVQIPVDALAEDLYG